MVTQPTNLLKPISIVVIIASSLLILCGVFFSVLTTLDVDEHPYITAQNCTIIHPTLSCEQVTNVGDTCTALVCLHVNNVNGTTNSTETSMDIVVTVGEIQCPKSNLRTVLDFPNVDPYISYSSGDNVTCYTNDNNSYFVSYLVYYKSTGAPWKVLSGLSWGTLVAIIGPITIVVIVYWIMICCGVIKKDVFVQELDIPESKPIQNNHHTTKHKQRHSKKYERSSTTTYDDEEDDDGVVTQI